MLIKGTHFSLQDVLDLPALLDGVAEDDGALAGVGVQLDGLQQRRALVLEHLPPQPQPPSPRDGGTLSILPLATDLVRVLGLHPGAAAVHQQLLHVRRDAVQPWPAQVKLQ